MSNRGHRGQRILCWWMQMARAQCSFSSDCGSEFSGGFRCFGISWCLSCTLTKGNPCAKNLSLIFYMNPQLTLLWDFRMIRWVFFCNSRQQYFPAWSIICLGFSVVCSRLMCLRGLKCVTEPQIANTPLQLELSTCFVIPIKCDNFTTHKTKKRDQAIIPLLSSPLQLREYVLVNAYWPMSLVCVYPPLLPAERYHTLLHLYQSTRPSTVSCCPAWFLPKLSCVAATWSSCKPLSKLPARSRKPARRPFLTCAGTAPPWTSPLMPRSIGQTSTEVWS